MPMTLEELKARVGRMREAQRQATCPLAAYDFRDQAQTAATLERLVDEALAELDRQDGPKEGEPT